MDLSGYVLETLREDREFALYRARPQGDSGSVLVQAPVAGEPQAYRSRIRACARNGSRVWAEPSTPRGAVFQFTLPSVEGFAA
jgi:hypothetical protein